MELIPKGEDIRHWGSYDAVDHGFDARTQGPIGRAVRQAAFARQAAAFGTVVAPPPANPMQVLFIPPGGGVFYENRGRLQYVRQELQPAFLNALAPTEFVPSGPPQGGAQAGTVRASLSTAGPAWYNESVQAGAAVLLDIGSSSTQQPLFYISADPAFIGSQAYSGEQQPGAYLPPGILPRGGPLAIVAIPPGLEAQAQAYSPAPQPVVPPPPQPRPGVPPAASASPPWGAIIVGGLVLTGIGILVARGVKR